jgi:hypothetical protein
MVFGEKHMKDFLLDGRIGRRLDFSGYLRLLERDARTPLTEKMDETRRSRLRNAPLNYQRTTRITRTYEVPDEPRRVLGSLRAPQLWMVLSEPWCGDSAQSLPILAKLAGCTPHITLRILLRDENPDIMDQYLTDGTRGIPKLVAFDEQGDELFQWGPRPRGAREEFLRAKAEGIDRAQALERVHLWYGRDCGWAVQEEITALLRLACGASQASAS